ncbi:undecaprenyldiphospho-muramoylpentapeptide beta-N-acetylglucosaminyltransferase [Comamonas denitrificans]|jgi:UDP-N-acetylglucosamine--N-acetylmuramyl-(pentapeptide) pyrophosphoryl-undecaprenol N-acetylglucosamine transferase|uniref:UDP-N-acetylglucosamine--N-acetylmuramyl-(pentapeptide) pyrophosphoryl-undecaprenol N-acetylglucosamine transferase n=1 Tax=Comamonas denitrificans TaxID=117506 RepID=A0A939GVP7_9BURK|nr:undecaprenyldiphospho-muramoylpentapeptide beta-N-acetylglucosaminyltransferase [Comamonas denitrificans]MBP6293390.1 undecaprenyldiphospho-muramoylpentapeptide beta-N-acetylglucosaminyltransferase [Comamonas sp.]MBO1249890.1 undecaprenyldiphospho-muramoylpentapeptide beta-N-acetylglucosaminyltransferase [Comamonas denitrificans]MBP7931729.1 undecaprenyldiphospho-muramoylpentapeptide beta-N-acetylglucosaminyltransferase [Comamonas sp.]MBP7940499.1 undecaprenyldiphospho-muramoylpentapeptide b
MSATQKTALVMAGGTGGHIFPGLAVAQALREQGWKVHWLGAPGSMEERLVPPQGFPLETIDFSGVRGKGLLTLALLPLRLLKAFAQAWAVVRRVRPDVVIGLGGYISFPGGMMATLAGKPLILHEQNSVAGMANKVLANVASRVFCAFPNALPGAQWVGNPLRQAFLQQPPPAERFAGRSGPLRILVVGGSLGAKALNDTVPQALALIPPEQRPQVRHQSGAKQMQALQASYAAAGVQAELTPFIDDTASAYAQADLVICRAGASTVTELAAVGAAAIYVPFPHAVDDHQTTNARFVVDAGGGWVVQQTALSPEKLAHMIQNMQRSTLLETAQKAKMMQKTEATAAVVAACQELAR